ncbi:TniQ family protein [Kitasatospora sp. NPDC056731]|uniref:TniQ family protein n=1 Tax=Kitasatospora sp. NPDC056731 TaxID=3155422 RepID=UPI00342D2E3B
MNLSDLPVRRLPLTVRPLAEETVISFVTRLASANEIPAATLFRHLAPCHPGRRIIDMDAVLSLESLERLAVLSGRDTDALARTLPGQDHTPHTPLELGRPGLRWFRTHPRPQLACLLCTSRRGISDAVRVRVKDGRRVCRVHRRWTDGLQRDLAKMPEIIDAHARYRALLDGPRRLRAPTMVWKAQCIALNWSWERMHPVLSERWAVRARKLNIAFPYRGYDSPAAQCVVFPETVALAETLCHPDWRRHVAMVRDADLEHFYRYAFQAVGIPKASNRSPVQGDPITFWAGNLRAEHAKRRFDFWRDPLAAVLTRTPFPNIRHFA